MVGNRCSGKVKMFCYFVAIGFLVADIFKDLKATPVRQQLDGINNCIGAFQRIFRLPETGIIDYPTWYKIQEIYVGVSRIAELT